MRRYLKLSNSLNPEIRYTGVENWDWVGANSKSDSQFG